MIIKYIDTENALRDRVLNYLAFDCWGRSCSNILHMAETIIFLGGLPPDDARHLFFFIFQSKTFNQRIFLI